MRTLALLLAAAVALALLVGAPRAFAHANFTSASPAPSSTVAKPPRKIEVNFTERLNGGLTTAKLSAGGRGHPADVDVSGKTITLRPLHSLPGGETYRVEFKTVSAEDGDAIGGSYGFTVREQKKKAAARKKSKRDREKRREREEEAAAGGSGGEHGGGHMGGTGLVQTGHGSTDENGNLPTILRILFYGSLFFFAGGIINAAFLARGRHPREWLIPHELDPGLIQAGVDHLSATERVWRVTLGAGVLAAVSALALALAESADAGTGLDWSSIEAYLFSNTPGLARVGVVIALAASVVVLAGISRIGRWLTIPSATLCVLAFLALAMSGHSNAADARAVAVISDWIHLAAAAAWLGGIAQIAAVWVPVALRSPHEVDTAAWVPDMGKARRRLHVSVMRMVLERFGTIALPAFAIIATTGAINALIQLGSIEALWETYYGRLLAVKIALVATIMLASYWHAMRLRPKVVEASGDPQGRLDRRHWRVLASEPLLGAAVIAVAALLVNSPLPDKDSEQVAGEPAAQQQAR